MPSSDRAPGDPRLAARLRDRLQGEVRFDAFTRGLFSTDASHYQVEPLGVVFPRSTADVEAVMEVAREEGVPVLPRGAGTSQCGQTVGRALVVDGSRHLTEIGAPTYADPRGADGLPTRVEVEPGVVLDLLNRALAPTGIWFPVDPSTGNRATLGGMAGNNSAGARSLRYGMMVENVAAVEVLLPDGRRCWIGEGEPAEPLAREMGALARIHAERAAEIRARTPATLRNVAGYDLTRLATAGGTPAGLLVGSEGTLAYFTRLRLKLAPRPTGRVLGVAHFRDLHGALESVERIVELEPSAVELVDEHVLRLAAGRPAFRDAARRFIRGRPGAVLLVEFDAGSGRDEPARRLDDLAVLLADLGHPDAVVPLVDPEAQAALWGVRKAGLNIVMSMAGPRKPISFVEDCAVPLPRLGEYARRVDEVFARHGCSGTWYAHASVGCLHVRPALDLADPDDVVRMRRIAEEVHQVVRELEGTHSGEHGDGILRSEFLEAMLGPAMVEAFREVKRVFDPEGRMNPGKIVDPPRMDDRSLFRRSPERIAGGYTADAAARALPVVLDWSAEGGMLGAADRCDNNGACRKRNPGVMCPSYRVTGDERHATRGRANGLRLALGGQLGADALHSPEMAEAMSLCISCKGCRRECPAGVDLAKLKLEWLHARNERSGVPRRERWLAELPRTAPRLSRLGRVANAVAALPGTRRLAARALGLSPRRRLPRWHPRPWSEREAPWLPLHEADAVLFVDTFTRWFEPGHARAALALLRAGGHRAAVPPAPDRPLCCGRTFLSAGMLREARAEMERTVEALAGAALAGVPVVGLEPSCVFTLADELPALVPGGAARAVADSVVLVEAFLERAWDGGHPLPFRERDPGTVLVHGHCHQKAFDATAATLAILRRIPGAGVEEIPSGCCGMAGGFGYGRDTYATSLAMGELDLLPAVRAADPATRIVADGTSCRTQITDATGRDARHAVTLLAEALEEGA